MAGKLVILYVKSRVDGDKLRAELALTYALKLRSACTGRICEKVIGEKLTEILKKNTEISEGHIAALYFLASKNRKEYRLVGCLGKVMISYHSLSYKQGLNRAKQKLILYFTQKLIKTPSYDFK